MPLFIHERISAQAILETAKRNDVQRDLFGDPQQKYRDAVQFYEHEVPWSNRLILGDSLQAMDSLANREGLAGQVQMIYMDPPYGINFRSNFQPDVFKKSVSDSEKDLTREVEQVNAYRDTWKLGIHSYLSYLRKRLVVSRELLKDSGSIFVQIGVSNVHRVRCLLDEVFGPENFVNEIVLKTRSTSTSRYLSTLNDFILWYAKDYDQLKFRHLFSEKERGDRFSKADLPSGEVISVRAKSDLPENAKPFTNSSLSATSGSGTAQPFIFRDKEYRPAAARGWRCTLEGLERLGKAERLIVQKGSTAFKYYFSDFSYTQLKNLWEQQLSEINKIYVVQTSPKAIQRCMLMSTDPGDLVIDPTCGSGTTAYVAEQWGRRWITVDTSRIAITQTRNRLVAATYDYYKLKDNAEGVSGGFLLKTAPHIQLKDIANNVALDPIFAKYEPILAEKLADLNAALKAVTPAIRQELQRKLATKKRGDVTDADARRWNLPETAWDAWEVPYDTDPAWPEPLQEALISYRQAWRAKMDAVNTCIAESAQSEELVDQPEVEKHLSRVSGPFTVESVQPPTASLDTIGDTPDALDTEPANATAHLEQLYTLLKTGGVNLDNGKKKFARLDRLEGGILHAEGQFEEETGEVAVVFGPQNGTVTAHQVEDCLGEAREAGYNALLLAGFHFEPEAQAILQAEHRRFRTYHVQIAPDVVMDDLLRQRDSDQLFTVIGAPRTLVKKRDDGQFVVTMEGMDTYNPVDNTIEPTRAEHVPAWFLDTNYDRRTFCPTQSFFPNKAAWKNIARSLKAVIDMDSLEAFSGTVSLPFSAGSHNRIAVKVIDKWGNEAMAVHPLGESREE